MFNAVIAALSYNVDPLITGLWHKPLLCLQFVTIIEKLIIITYY